jgi:[acyl-carrier-protein] S-malonyltransferase
MGMIGYLYPGQSPQKVGMGRDLYHRFARAREIFNTADAFLGFPLSNLCFKGPTDQLNQDLNCQLAVYTHSCAVSAILKDHGLEADVVSGYSSGFYAAAYGAGCFTFTQGLEIVHRAGVLLLERAAEVDSSLGVVFGLDPEEVIEICRQSGQVQPAIFNTPRQIIISGLTDQVETALQKAQAAGALDTYRLPAATAYHSALMAPVGERLLKVIDPKTLNPPQRKLISYSSLTPIMDARDLVETMAMQLSNPVRWVELIQNLRGKGLERTYEIGPGQVLTRTLRWIDRNIEMSSLHDAPALDMILNLKAEKQGSG